MTEISSKYIKFFIDTPDYLEECPAEKSSGLIFQVKYGEKTLYVGLAGGAMSQRADCEIREVDDNDVIEFTLVGLFVLDLLNELPVEYPVMVFAEILDETANDERTLLSRIHRVFDKADNFSKILLFGDLSGALDGKVTPLLNCDGTIEVEDLASYKANEG